MFLRFSRDQKLKETGSGILDLALFFLFSPPQLFKKHSVLKRIRKNLLKILQKSPPAVEKTGFRSFDLDPIS